MTKDEDITTQDNAESKDLPADQVGQRVEGNNEESSMGAQGQGTTDDSGEDLHAKIKNLEEVAKKAQYDYVMLKYDFDSYQRRVENESKDQKSQSIVDIMKKILPIVDQLSYSVEHMPEEMKGNNRADGVKLIYDNAMKLLSSLGIEKIATIGQDPDSDLHEPLSMEPAEDEAMKGKIIKEYEAGYTIKQGETQKVIKAAKVIVGQ